MFATGAILASGSGAALSWGQAITLGVVQGLTEFLPVSSSGHLVLFERVLGVARPGLALEAGLHLGTLLAVLWMVGGDLIGRRGAAAGGVRLWALLGIGSLPVAFGGLVLAPTVDRLFGSLTAVGCGWLAAGCVLLWASFHASGRRPMVDLGPRDALVIGLAQLLALAPGFSRSGATIAAGLGCDLDPEASARFAFLLSIPAVGGAVLLHAGGLLSALDGGGGVAIWLGIAVAATSGAVAMRLCVAVLRNGRLASFAYYCLVLGALAVLRGIVAR